MCLVVFYNENYRTGIFGYSDFILYYYTMEKIRVIVDIEPMEEGRTSIHILQPQDQVHLTNQEMARVLAGGLALCIRSCDNDTEVMEETMDYLQKEFVNIDFEVGRLKKGK